MILKIRTTGDPLLRQKSRILSAAEIRIRAIQDLIAAMRDTMRDAPGVGLAAPQVGEPLQLAVIEDRAEYHKNMTKAELQERQRVPIAFHVIINPELESQDPLNDAFFEGCLSVPGFMGTVPRARSVRVTCLDEHAQPRVIDAKGWYARILQHEIDHLQGRLYLDSMQSQTFTTFENYQRHWKGRSK